MARDLTPWAVDETDALLDWIANPKSMTQKALAYRLQRSPHSVRNKIAWLRSLERAQPVAPTPRKNDHEKHLRLLLAAMRQEAA